MILAQTFLNNHNFDLGPHSTILRNVFLKAQFVGFEWITKFNNYYIITSCDSFCHGMCDCIRCREMLGNKKMFWLIERNIKMILVFFVLLYFTIVFIWVFDFHWNYEIINIMILADHVVSDKHMRAHSERTATVEQKTLLDVLCSVFLTNKACSEK